MHFDLKLWRMTSGLRSRIALSAALGLLALAVGIARFAFLGQFLAGVFRGETLILPLLAAAAAILLAWFDHRRSRRTASASRHRHAAFKSFGEEFLDAVQGLPTLKAFGQSAAYGRMLATKARALSDSTFWALSLNVLTRAFTDLGTAFGSAAALALGAYRVRHGEMSIEALLIVLMAGTEIFRPLRDLRAVLHQGLNGQAAANGINALLDAEAPHADGTRSEALTPEIVFDSVAFAYPGGRRSAHAGLSFGIGAGERVGIVGPSGSGKSAIVRLLSRLYEPQGGSIRIGGRNLASLDPAQVRDMIAVVSQDTYLFHGSVEDNLRLGRPDATGADLIAAATAANAHGFIAALPQGYQTVIGERGTQLSGGQPQRLAIARAVLRDSPILILDEALSSVDTENEAIIQQALDRLTIGRTTLILAHRLSSVIGADRILVLGSGGVAQSGTHRELIGVPGPYRDLMRPQLAGSDTVFAPAAAAEAPGADAPAIGPVAGSLSEDAGHVGWPQTIRTLLHVVRPYRVQLAIAVLTGIGRVAAFIGVSVLGALVLGAVRNGTPTGVLVAALLITAPLAGLLHWLESWIAHAMAYALLADMRIDLFRKLDALAPSYLLRRRSGDLVALATQDVETVEYFFAHTIAPAIVAVLVPVAVIATLAWFAWPLACVLAPFLQYAGASPVLGRQRIDRLGSAAREALGLIGAYATETIQGLAELVIFGATVRRRDGFMTAVRAYQTLRLSLLDDLSFQAAMLDAVTGLGGLAVAAIGAVLVTDGIIAPAMLPLLVLISVAAFLPVSEIAQVGRQLADTIASTRRLHVVHAEPVLINDGKLEPAVPSGGSGVRFEDVDFTYPGRTLPAVSHMTFDVPPGSTVAFVGPSGAGKTTVANLLLRFWDPQSGTIRLDGVDLRDLTLDGLRGRIAMVAQDTYLFNDTLEANVRLARPDATREQVARALSRAALADFVAELPEGLATRVGERGVQLSGGQRQRISIARAFLKNAPMLILDEATSHLDTLSEQAVRKALDALMADRTTIVVAHRLSTVRAADVILVLRDGRVIESGSHDALIAQGGFLRPAGGAPDGGGGRLEAT
jgi:ATP-binding cassette subfamily C protein CydCD